MSEAAVSGAQGGGHFVQVGQHPVTIAEGISRTGHSALGHQPGRLRLLG
jgi:hypothetical protein